MGAEISCSRSFPLISERCLHSGGGRLLAGAWCRGGFETRPCLPGTRFGRCRSDAGDGGRAECWRKLRPEIFVLRLFPLISERCLHSGGGRLLAGAWCRGGFETRPCLPGTRFGRCRSDAGDGGQGRVLAEDEAGNFCAPLISAQIRHFGVAGHAWALGRRAPGGRSALGVLGTTKHGTPRASVAVHNWPCRLSGGFMGRTFLSYLCSN